jgi:hypothetical protein
MTKSKNITILIDLSGYCISHGLACRNEIREKIESKLAADNNGQCLGSGWFEGTGDIGFYKINDVVKAEESIVEVFDEIDMWDIFIRMDNYESDEYEEDQEN